MRSTPSTQSTGHKMHCLRKVARSQDLKTRRLGSTTRVESNGRSPGEALCATLNGTSELSSLHAACSGETWHLASNSLEVNEDDVHLTRPLLGVREMLSFVKSDMAATKTSSQSQGFREAGHITVLSETDNRVGASSSGL